MSEHFKKFLAQPAFRAETQFSIYVLPISPAEWTDVFQILKEKKDVSPISQNVWNKILARLRDLRSTNVLDGMTSG